MPPDSTSLILGIDGGGTKTAAAVATLSGTILGHGEGGVGSLNARTDCLHLSLKTAVANACEMAGLDSLVTRFTSACLGVAGYSLEQKRLDLFTSLPSLISSHFFRLEPDYRIAFEGATGGNPGIVVIAGTGAITYGRDNLNREWREDGLGYLLGDRGSGFNLGLQALRYTLEMMKDGREDAITQAVLKQTGAGTQSQVLQWIYSDFQTARVAGIAPVIGRLADEGEPQSRSLVALMARRLRHSVREAKHRLFMAHDTPVYPLGGLWNISRFLQQEFAEPSWQFTAPWERENETNSGRRFNVQQPAGSAVQGAVALAMLSVVAPD